MNSLVKAINGNINNNNFNIISWNKGNSHLSNRMEAIKQIIINNKPQVLIICELNFKQEDHLSLTNIQGYKFKIFY